MPKDPSVEKSSAQLAFKMSYDQLKTKHIKKITDFTSVSFSFMNSAILAYRLQKLWNCAMNEISNLITSDI